MTTLYVAAVVAVAGALQHRLVPRVPSGGASISAASGIDLMLGSTQTDVLRSAGVTRVRMFAEPPPDADDEDVFGAMSGSLTPMQERLRGFSPLLMGATANTVMMVSALVAWFLTPLPGRAGAVGSVIAGGLGGRKLGKSMRAQRRAVVPAVIADMVREGGLASLKPNAISKLAERYEVDAIEFEEQLSDVYSKYLRQLLDADEIAPAQISQLGQLRRGIGLRWNSTEAVHVKEVARFLNGQTLDDGELPAELSALLWLTTGLFGTSKGQADTADLQRALQLDERTSQRLVNQMSMPFYRKAVTVAVGKYNRTEAPEKLRIARKALSLTEQCVSTVHSAIYDAQLEVLLADGEAKLNAESMELLGELEGILQVRSAASRLQARTLPLFQQRAQEILESSYGDGAAASAVGVWGSLALRQQELSLPTETAQAMFTDEARRLIASKIDELTRAATRTDPKQALEELTKVVQYAQFLGEMMSVSGGYGETPPIELASRYLGALTLSPEAEREARRLADQMANAPPELQSAADLLSSMLCLSDPAYASAREAYTTQLDSIVAAASFDDDAARMLEQRASELGLPFALAQKLALDAYYGWLIDSSERGDRGALERCATVRACLGVRSAAVAELHSNTGVDEIILTAVCEQLLEEESPLSSTGEQTLAYIERQLNARPGVASAIIAGASEA